MISMYAPNKAFPFFVYQGEHFLSSVQKKGRKRKEREEMSISSKGYAEERKEKKC